MAGQSKPSKVNNSGNELDDITDEEEQAYEATLDRIQGKGDESKHNLGFKDQDFSRLETRATLGQRIKGLFKR